MESDSQKQLKYILGFQATSPPPSQDICTLIANLKDLYELQGITIRSEWRRGNDSGVRGRFHPSAESPNMRRGGASGVETPISRVSSTSSLACGSPYPTSPPPPIAKYKSQFKNSNQPIEDKILNNIILSKLNKFSPKTYNEIRDFLYQILGSGEPELQEIIPDFIKLVFRKAAIEKIFCPLYAKLLSEISSRYSVILTEMHALQSNYLNIFDDIHEPESNDYALFIENQKNKEFRHGYSQFLAELTALEILNLDYLNKIFEYVLANMIHFGKIEDKRALLEEYSDCIACMAKVLKKKPGTFFVKARQTLLASNEKNINDLITNSANYISESAKTRFILMDVYDILKG